MSANYKKLGDYIQPVDVRNSDLKVSHLLGVSVEKRFIESIANTIGTDFSKYKIVKKGQFTYIPDTSRRGDKIGIALLTDFDEGLVSNIYTVFEITDTTKLLPEYLMLWFSRPEFDRYARYKSHGSVREIFDWDEMCRVELPVPDLKEQEKIVNTYNAITKRIQLKQKINENLEKTAQTIYKKMFVEDADENWKTIKLGELAELSAGGDKPECFSITKTEKCNIPIFSNGIENYGLYGFTDKPKITKESVTVSARGTIGFPCLRLEPYFPIIRLVSVTPYETYTDAIYLYYYLKNTNIVSSGTTQQQLTVPEFRETKIVVPNRNTVDEFSVKVRKLFYYQKENEKEISKLQELKQLVISRISGM